MAIATDVRKIPDVLQALRATPPPGGRVLSVYLDTSPGRTLGQAYLLAFRDACRAGRAALAGADQRERDLFEAAARTVDQVLTDGFSPLGLGIAIFAAGQGNYCYAAPMPMAPPDRIGWGQRPEIEPLEEALAEFDRIAVLLFDKERTRLYLIYLGEIEERYVFLDEVPGKQATGDWFGLSQARYARHHEDHVLRHAKRTIQVLNETLREWPFDRLFISGPDEAVALLEHHLPRPLRNRLAGKVHLELFASEATILQAAHAAAEEAKRRDDLKAVADLRNAARTSHAVVGLHETLAALSDGRVHRLIVGKVPQSLGGECPECGRLVGASGPCPSCGAEMTPVGNLRERAIAAALDQGARVEVVAGDAATRLADEGGLGAWTRY